MNRRASCMAIVGMFVCTGSVAQALYQVPRDIPTPSQPVSSPVLDARSAADARLRNEPVYVESIVVEGRNPDAPARRKALEVRFAEALAPRPSPLAGINPLNDAPCTSLTSTWWNGVGDTHVPLSGCPR